MQSLVCFLHELSMLSKIQRSGFAFLGTGKQSVAEHSFGMALIAWTLADKQDQSVDKQRLLLLCLLHDFLEARTGDMNYVQKKYVQIDEKQVLQEIQKDYPEIGKQIASLQQEYKESETLEAQLAHDADQLELLLILKQQQDIGNPQAEKWMDNAVKRLKTSTALQLAEEIRSTSSDTWWMKNKEDPHWVKPK